MGESSVSLAALGIMATTVAALIWLLKKQFTQSDTTLKNLTVVLEKVNQSFNDEKACRATDEEDKRKFQSTVVKTLSKLSTTQDTILDRQLGYGKDIINTNEIVTKHISIIK